jgi:hypothetical protein
MAFSCIASAPQLGAIAHVLYHGYGFAVSQRKERRD